MAMTYSQNETHAKDINGKKWDLPFSKDKKAKGANLKV